MPVGERVGHPSVVDTAVCGPSQAAARGISSGEARDEVAKLGSPGPRRPTVLIHVPQEPFE